MAEKESKIKGNSLGASGFTLGIASIVFCGLFGVVMSITGFVFCLVQQKKKPTKLAKVGLIINVVGLVLSIVWILYLGPLLQKLITTLPTA